MIRMIMWCFGQAVYEAACDGRFGPSGTWQWRDAQVVLFVLHNHLYGDESLRLR